MPGYSKTPAARKLGVKPGSTLLLVDVPDGWQLPALPNGVSVQRDLDSALEAVSVNWDADAAPAQGEAAPDVVLAFARTAAVLRERIGLLATVIYPAGAVWIAWPRKAGGHVSDVTENLIREVALPLGLVDNKVAAIDDDWSGLRLSWRRELRTR